MRQAADAGVDLFRVFDCLNWVENMRVSMEAVAEAGKLVEGAMCYTGDILDPARSKYDIKYYVNLAHELEKAGAHIIGIKDMAGLLKPVAARQLITALRQETDLPIHLHTHDTSGISASSVLAAVEVGVDAFDAAIDSMSGLTSQPCLGSLVEALKGTGHDTGLDPEAIRKISFYFEKVRGQYLAFESDLRFGASEVYLHEMPGGQFTNLKEQARSLGLEARWHEVARAYADVNMMFGDIVKVTPSSKVVGDLALMMVAGDLTPEDVVDPDRDIAFPGSVVQMMHGDLGQPPGGWPEALQKKVLKGEPPITVRPGSLLPAADLDAERKAAEEKAGVAIDDRALASYLMYPKVFADFAHTAEHYGPVSVVPTPVFFYGLPTGAEIPVELERGKTLIVRNQAIGEPDAEGNVRVFFELNGQPRMVKVPDRSLDAAAGGGTRTAQGGGGQSAACRRPHAGCRLDAGRPRRPGGQDRRRALVHRGDEDGDGASCRARRRDRRGAHQSRRPDRRQGPAAGVRGVGPARPPLRRAIRRRRKRPWCDRATHGARRSPAIVSPDWDTIYSKLGMFRAEGRGAPGLANPCRGKAAAVEMRAT